MRLRKSGDRRINIVAFFRGAVLEGKRYGGRILAT